MTVSPTASNSGNTNGKLSTISNSKSSPSKSASIKSIHQTGITIKRKSITPAVNNNSINSSSSAGISQTANKKTKKAPSTNNSKTGTNTSSVNSVPFDSEATLCPICDEACTCPKTASTIVVPKPVAKKSTGSLKKATVMTGTKSVNKKEKPKYLNLTNNSRKKLQSYDLTDSSDYADDDDYDEKEEDNERSSETETTKIVEDPALSFIRMIYSDEESLDEEEAYALYQATQLFSSSDEEADQLESRGFKTRFIDGDVDEENDYSTSESDSDADDNEFEYTVVEYVQPIKKSRKSSYSSHFVAYDSDDDDDDEGDRDEGDDLDKNDNDKIDSALSASLQDQLLLNTTSNDRGSDQDEEMDSCDEMYVSAPSSSDEEEDEVNWMTYSVFDIDSDLPNLTGGVGGTSLSSHGSGTPDTLLFSTSSTDKIPIIAPQVLAAISAAAKHMAASNTLNSTTGSSSSKYFSYITLKETCGEDVNGEEFLFFEEGCTTYTEVSENDEEEEEEVNEEDDTVDIEDCSDISSCDDSINSMDSLSDGGVGGETGEESLSDESVKKKRLPSPSIRSVSGGVRKSSTIIPAPLSTDFMTSLDRWNRVPIGTFRRSRRPSIPSYHYNVNPSIALKTFSTDPASLTLTTAPYNNSISTSSINSNSNNNTNEDSFDEGASLPDGPEHRSHSVVTWDELDLDIVTSISTPSSTWPIPKRSRSVISSTSTNLTNNFEWLNNSNWNWEI